MSTVSQTCQYELLGTLSLQSWVKDHLWVCTSSCFFPFVSFPPIIIWIQSHVSSTGSCTLPHRDITEYVSRLDVVEPSLWLNYDVIEHLEWCVDLMLTQQVTRQNKGGHFRECRPQTRVCWLKGVLASFRSAHKGRKCPDPCSTGRCRTGRKWRGIWARHVTSYAF